MLNLSLVRRRPPMSAEIAPISEVERDALCEFANVAMARAATSIRRMVGRQILLSVPTCDILASEAAAERLAKPGNTRPNGNSPGFAHAFQRVPALQLRLRLLHGGHAIRARNVFLRLRPATGGDT